MSEVYIYVREVYMYIPSFEKTLRLEDSFTYASNPKKKSQQTNSPIFPPRRLQVARHFHAPGNQRNYHLLSFGFFVEGETWHSRYSCDMVLDVLVEKELIYTMYFVCMHLYIYIYIFVNLCIFPNVYCILHVYIHMYI